MQNTTELKNSFCIQTFRDTITSICKFDILSYLSTIHTLYKALCYRDLVPGSGFTISLVITQRSLPNSHPVTEADSTLVLKHDSYLRKQRNNHLRDMTELLLIIYFYVFAGITGASSTCPYPLSPSPGPSLHQVPRPLQSISRPTASGRPWLTCSTQPRGQLSSTGPLPLTQQILLVQLSAMVIKISFSRLAFRKKVFIKI